MQAVVEMNQIGRDIIKISICALVIEEGCVYAGFVWDRKLVCKRSLNSNDLQRGDNRKEETDHETLWQTAAGSRIVGGYGIGKRLLSKRTGACSGWLIRLEYLRCG